MNEESLPHPRLVYRRSVDVYAHRGDQVVLEEGNAQRSDMDALGMKYSVGSQDFIPEMDAIKQSAWLGLNGFCLVSLHFRCQILRPHHV